MEHVVTINAVVGVKAVRDLKDKSTGLLNGKINVTGSYEGGKIDFQIEKSKINPSVGDHLKIVFDATPTMVRQDFGQNNTSWRDGFIVGEILSCEILKK